MSAAVGKVYFICVGERGSRYGEFACLKAFKSLPAALVEFQRQCDIRAGEVGFEEDDEESGPEHIYLAWSSPTHTIWLEQLELE